METIYPPNPSNLPKSRFRQSWFRLLRESLLHLAFPHICEGCGTDVIDAKHYLCLQCLDKLPETHFENHPHNPVEKIFWGRLPVTAATAKYYFTKGATLQHLLHQFKYKGHQRLGFYLGQLMGSMLINNPRFQDVTALVPLPLFPEKERQRGYNQALILCNGISDIWQRPIIKGAVIRATATESQTRKNRVERWQNMENRFELKNNAALNNQHVLLVDDVLTTGATLESCGRVILEAENTRLSIATLCISTS
jgi:ComF family protein